MENKILLTPNKRLVRVKGKDYELKSHKIGINGALYGFKVLDKEYIFIRRDDYLKRDISDGSNDKLLEGFVNLASYKTYITDPKTSYDTPYNLRFLLDSENWFDFQFETAVVGDIFLNERLETRKGNTQTDNYTVYYKRIKHEFRITTLDFNFFNPDLYPAENNDINSPSYSRVEVLDFSSSEINQPQRRFFNKNLANKISDISGDDNKEVLYVGMVKICWQISNIYKYVIQNIAITDLTKIMKDYISVTPATGITIREYIENSSLPTIDKIVANLLLDWGYRDDENTAELYPVYEDDQFYGGYYIPFNNYYNTLANVYEGLAYIDENNFFGVNTDPSTWTPETLREQNNIRLQYLINIIPQDSINFLDLDTKIRILKDFAVNPIYENREDAVVKITKSILPGQAVEFLYKLQTTLIVTDGAQKSLFELLYRKINDSIAFFGKNNRREFINQLYKLWYVSNLNPYHALDLSPENNDPQTTNAYYSQFYKNKVMTLDYDSQKYFGFFVDNMNFEFNTKTIMVYEEKTVGYTSTTGGESTPKKDFVKVGDYDFYTAISLKEFKEGDTAVKFPSIALEGANYVIPLFYLKYMDDFGDNEDMWTAIGLSVDVVLTFTGIGNLSKLRHFRHLTKLGRLAIGEVLPASERILALEALSGTAALVELTSSVASIILQYYTAGCTLYIPVVENNINDTKPNGQIPDAPNSYTQEQKKKYEFCKNLDQFLFWCQIASAGTDFISGYMVRKSARKLQQVGIPEDFPASGKQFIDDIADLDGAVVNFLNTIQHTHPNIYNKVSNFANDEDKFAFMFDFKNNPGGLSLIENDIFLLNEWQKFKSDIMHIRKDTKYLMSSKRFSSKAYEIEHITKVKNKRIPPSFDPAAGHGYKNIIDGHILNPNTIGLPSDMSSTIISQRNGHITYRPMWFKIPSDCTQPTIVSANLKEFPIGSGNWYKKKSVNTIWNPSWNEDRIREEIIYLWANKKIARLQKNTNLPPINNIQQNVTLYTSQLTDGTKVELRVNNIANQFNVSYQDIMSYLELKL